jgi:GT2 family glycosyltransferase
LDAASFEFQSGMKRAIIATVYNEVDNISRWWECLAQQKVLPEEIVIVDGGSQDGTWEKLQELTRHSPVPVRLKQQHCNIAEGRNLAIAMTDAEIIASSDAGTILDPNWFGEITRPLLEDKTIDIVGGKNVLLAESEFQKFVAIIEGEPAEPANGEIHGSGRNTAYRRSAWADVGGYPEWLTLTAEDALYNHELYQAGKRLSYNPAAVVYWMTRNNADDYFKMLYRYGYGSAEAQFNFFPYYFRKMMIVLFPQLLPFSRHHFHFLSFRYRKNLASASGWLAGWRKGHRPPFGWKKIKGTMMSPEAQQFLAKRRK